MGVKDLWSILAPVKSEMPLTDLAGQTVAVDLSVWIVETQSVKQMQGTVTKGYLRNLFFRCSHLMMLGVKLVFVVEGEPPEVKWEAMMKRQQTQGMWTGGGGPRGRRGRGGAVAAPKKMTRSHFKSVLQECCVMLDYLGLPYVQSCGEAEGTCARLNYLGLVDACMTNDGDAFLYGAKTVYRNFTMDRKDPHVEKYTMANINKSLDLNSERLVALGILLGCDYVPKGVPGVGKEIAMKYIKSLPRDEAVLCRFRKWRSEKDFSEMLSYVSMECRSAETTVRHKALKTSGFPFENVIREFMSQTENTKLLGLTFKWKRPKMFHLQKFHVNKLEWEEGYSLEKVLPLVTCHDLSTLRLQQGTGRALKQHLVPHSIVKTRVRQGIPCYEINWNKVEADTITPFEFYTTIEDQEPVKVCFPELVCKFEESLAKKKPSKKGKKKDPSSEHVASDQCLLCRHPQKNCTCASSLTAEMDIIESLQGLSLDAHPRRHSTVQSQTVSHVSKSHYKADNKSTLETTLSTKMDPNINSVPKFEKQDTLNPRMSDPCSVKLTKKPVCISDDSDAENDEVELLPLSQRLKLMADKSSEQATCKSEDGRLASVQQLAEHPKAAPVFSGSPHRDSLPVKDVYNGPRKDICDPSLTKLPEQPVTSPATASYYKTADTAVVVNKSKENVSSLMVKAKQAAMGHSTLVPGHPSITDQCKRGGQDENALFNKHTPVKETKLSFLYNDSDSCLLVSSDEELDSPTVGLIYDVNSSMVKKNVKTRRVLGNIQPSSVINNSHSGRRECNVHDNSRRRSLLGFSPLMLPGVNTPSESAKNSLKLTPAPIQRSTPFSRSQIGNFSLDLSFGSCSSFVNDNPPDNLANSPAFQMGGIAAMSPLSEPREFLVAKAYSLDDSSTSITDSPLCLSKRLALRFGSSLNI